MPRSLSFPKRTTPLTDGEQLAKKLGIKTEGMPIAILWEPDGFGQRIGLDENQYEVDLILGKHDLIILFIANRVVLREFFPLAISRMEPNARIWIAWPRKAAGGKTDLSAELVLAIAESLDMVEVGRCRIEESWNAIKFKKGTKAASDDNAGLELIAPYAICTVSPIPITPDPPKPAA